MMLPAFASISKKKEGEKVSTGDCKLKAVPATKDRAKLHHPDI